ncbi:hypothetical protein DITRI_Ditri20bG0120100 [Diplodiscus trichospermus]
MADGISTKLQKELGQQQKELERIEHKFDDSIGQLKIEIEQLGVDTQRMFEQIMAKLEPTQNANGVQDLKGKSSNEKEEIESFHVKSDVMVNREDSFETLQICQA